MNLQNKRIVLTGTQATIDNMAESLSATGAEIIPFPTIVTDPIHSDANYAALHQLETFDWLAFTSKQGVHSFFELWGKQSLPAQLKLAVIGEKTQEVLAEYGERSEFVSEGKDKMDMLAQWKGLLGPEEKILLAVSALADESLEVELTKVASVKRINVYTSRLPSKIDLDVQAQVKAGRYDWVVFTSPSSVMNYKKLMGILPRSESIFSIGPTTSKALQEEGCNDFLEAANPSAESIAESLEKLYTNQKSDHGIS